MLDKQGFGFRQHMRIVRKDASISVLAYRLTTANSKRLVVFSRLANAWAWHLVNEAIALSHNVNMACMDAQEAKLLRNLA